MRTLIVNVRIIGLCNGAVTELLRHREITTLGDIE